MEWQFLMRILQKLRPKKQVWPKKRDLLDSGSKHPGIGAEKMGGPKRGGAPGGKNFCKKPLFKGGAFHHRPGRLSTSRADSNKGFFSPPGGV